MSYAKGDTLRRTCHFSAEVFGETKVRNEYQVVVNKNVTELDILVPHECKRAQFLEVCSNSFPALLLQQHAV